MGSCCGAGPLGTGSGSSSSSSSNYTSTATALEFTIFSRSGENVILCELFHVVLCFPLHFMLYRGHLECISNSDSCHKERFRLYSTAWCGHRLSCCFLFCQKWKPNNMCFLQKIRVNHEILQFIHFCL